MPGEETWLRRPRSADQLLPGLAAAARRHAPSAEAGADGRAGEDAARVGDPLRPAAGRGQARPIPRDGDPDARGPAEARAADPAGGSAAPGRAPVRRPPGPTTAPAVEGDDRRWLEGVLRSEIRALTARVEELERQLRRRTVMLAVAAAVGALGAATAAGVAVVRHEPSRADQARAAVATAPFPGARGGADGAPGTLPPAPPRAGSGLGPPEEPAGPVSGERDGGPADLSTGSRTADVGPTPDAVPVAADRPPASGHDGGGNGGGTVVAGPAAPAPADDPGPVGLPSGATAGAAQGPVTPDGPAPPRAPEPVAASAEPSAVPLARTAGAPPAGRFAAYFLSVRPPARVAGEWRRLTERHPELAGLQPRAPRPVQVPGRGTFYAVEAGAFATRAEAQAVCDRLRPRAQACRVVAP